MSTVRNVERVRLDAIVIPVGRRPIKPDAIDSLAASMQRIGLQTPITVRRIADGSGYRLVTGHHRLSAAKKLDWDTIDCFQIDEDDTTARLIEIAENLHRADLSRLERDEQIAEWVRLTEGVSRQVVAKPEGGRPESGAAAASRELGMDKRDVQRAVKVSNMSLEAKDAARDAGIDDNRSALLKVAHEPTAEKQVAAVQEIASNRTYDRLAVEAEIKRRSLREAASIIVDHLNPAFLSILVKNLDLCGGTRLTKAIGKTRRRV